MTSKRNISVCVKSTMTQINKIEFRTVIIDGTDRELNILTYSKENFSLYFSLQSVAQCINELIQVYNAREIFHADFYVKYNELNLRAITEFQLQMLVPINLILEPSTELYNPMPLSLVQSRYLNDKYHNIILEYSDYTSLLNDIFCIAEKQNFTTGFNDNTLDFHHKFMNSIGFLSFIPILKMRYIRKMYKTFFLVDLLNSEDIDYIYDTLVLNRKRLQPEDIANVFQLNAEDIRMHPHDLTDDDKQLYVARFNRACRIFKSFAFNMMNEQSIYISKNLQIVTQFGLDRKAIEVLFRQMPKLSTTGREKYTDAQMALLCRPPSTDPLANLNATELNILHSIIKIHLMIQRMTNVTIHKEDLRFYRQILRSRFSTDIEELIYDSRCFTEDDDNEDDDIGQATLSFESLEGRRTMIKNYTIGEIIGEFIQLYVAAQQNVNTVWLCRFIRMSCNPRYSNLVNIMADFVPFFQRFFTNDFNINSINNLIIFLQGMCRPDEERLKSLKDFRDVRQMDVRNFRSFSLARYQQYNMNPLVTFIDLILTSKQTQKRHLLIDLNLLNETERYNLVYLVDPNEKQFIDYVYELVMIDKQDKDNNIYDLSGDRRFNLQHLDYDNIVPVVSANTFNENNTTTDSVQLFNGTVNQALFFHELSNRILFKVPGVVCNIVIK
ncbi:hypothetical protein [Drosophila suzukii associated hytrosavirus 1]|nr:hypothetical protein [Drosophila suzukii associated hytrosavirus 1]